MHTRNVLLIFVKNPEPGRVKTRLAETVGEERALEIYYELLRYTRSVAASAAERAGLNLQVWYSRFIPDKDLWSEHEAGFAQKKQRGDNLGERMRAAFEEAFSSGYEKVVIIGSDCGELGRDILTESYNKLDRTDLVIGPSQDGGYYLLGMKKLHGSLFRDIDWSTEQVFEQTMDRAEELGLSMAELPMLNDVDTEEDWKQVSDQFKVEGRK